MPGHPRQRTIPPAHQSAGGSEQPDQGDQTHGLRLQGLRLLFPENQGRLLREIRWAKERPRSACFIYPRSTSSGRYVLPWV